MPFRHPLPHRRSALETDHSQITAHHSAGVLISLSFPLALAPTTHPTSHCLDDLFRLLIQHILLFEPVVEAKINDANQVCQWAAKHVLGAMQCHKPNVYLIKVFRLWSQSRARLQSRTGPYRLPQQTQENGPSSSTFRMVFVTHVLSCR